MHNVISSKLWKYSFPSVKLHVSLQTRYRKKISWGLFWLWLIKDSSLMPAGPMMTWPVCFGSSFWGNYVCMFWLGQKGKQLTLEGKLPSFLCLFQFTLKFQCKIGIKHWKSLLNILSKKVANLNEKFASDQPNSFKAMLISNWYGVSYMAKNQCQASHLICFSFIHFHKNVITSIFLETTC